MPKNRGSGDDTVNWYKAAQTGGNAVLSVNKNLLIIVEGLDYSEDLTGAYNLPMKFDVADRLGIFSFKRKQHF